jgi:hypothetical protein
MGQYTSITTTLYVPTISSINLPPPQKKGVGCLFLSLRFNNLKMEHIICTVPSTCCIFSHVNKGHPTLPLLSKTYKPTYSYKIFKTPAALLHRPSNAPQFAPGCRISSHATLHKSISVGCGIPVICCKHLPGGLAMLVEI